MANSFVHILLTRFNTAMDYAPSSRRLEPDWLDKRLDLFERYCLPSVRAQRDAEFKWLVFFDEESPVRFKQKVESLRPLISPIYIKGLATDEVIAEKVNKTGLVTTPYLVTTRLDNDDALASTHLSLVQQAFDSQEREFIEFPVGLQSFRDSLYNVYWPSNPFLSLVERVKEGQRFTTVLSMPHDQVKKRCRVKSLVRSPQWLQVLHSANLLNSLRGWPRLGAQTHQDFEVLWPEGLLSDSLPARIKFSFDSYANRVLNKLAKNSRQ
jgi:Putative rhamnosyl transferase